MKIKITFHLGSQFVAAAILIRPRGLFQGSAVRFSQTVWHITMTTIIIIIIWTGSIHVDRDGETWQAATSG